MTDINCILPSEILHEILVAVREKSRSGLLACLLVCRAWHKLGLPLLYQNVELREWDLGPFIDCLYLVEGRRNLSLIRSLKIHARLRLNNDDSDAGSNERDGNGETRGALEFWEALIGHGRKRMGIHESVVHQDFDVIFRWLPKFSKLSTLRLILDSRTDVRIRGSLINGLLCMLPEHCTNLEIKMQGPIMDDDDDTVHICETIRMILPRMEHVRLQLRRMCSDLIGKTVQKPCRTKEFKPIALANLQTLTLDCFGSEHCKSPQPFDDPCWPPEVVDDFCWSWYAVTGALERLVKCNGALPPFAKLFVTDFLFWPQPRGNYRTYFRTEITSQTTLVFPYVVKESVGVPDAFLPLFVRDTEGNDIISPIAERYVNSQMWTYEWGGKRLPWTSIAPWAQEEYHPPSLRLPAGLWTRLSQEENICELWDNEKIAGQKLLFAEERVGPRRYLSRNPVRERTPPGFIRTESHELVKLEGTDSQQSA
ncbi:hypothetical protein VTO42DRAFT_7198 [Malbranchea cinnamomea]